MMYNSHDYVFISKHDSKVKEAYDNFINLIKDVQDYIYDYHNLTFRFDVIGSYKLNMITYDQKSNIGFDFDFNIEPNDPDKNFTATEVNNMFKRAFDYVTPKYGYRYASRSSRVFTIKKVNFWESRIEHSCDFAIVFNNPDTKKQQYIRFNKDQQTYYWKMQGKGFYQLPKKLEWIKKNKLWDEYRNYYLFLKNTNQDEDKHSRSLRAEAAQIICQQYGYYK